MKKLIIGFSIVALVFGALIAPVSVSAQSLTIDQIIAALLANPTLLTQLQQILGGSSNPAPTQGATARVISSSAQLLSNNGEDSQIAARFVVEIKAGSRNLAIRAPFVNVLAEASTTGYTSAHTPRPGFHSARYVLDGVEMRETQDYVIPANTSKKLTVYGYFNTRYMLGGIYTIKLNGIPNARVLGGSENSIYRDEAALFLLGSLVAPQKLTIFGEKFAQIHSISVDRNVSAPTGDLSRLLTIHGSRFNKGPNTVYFVEWNGTKYVDIGKVDRVSDGFYAGTVLSAVLPANIASGRSSIGVQVQNPNTPTSEYYNYGRSNVYTIQLVGAVPPSNQPRVEVSPSSVPINNNFTVTWGGFRNTGVEIYLHYPDGATCLLSKYLSGAGDRAYMLNGYKCPNLTWTVTPGKYRILVNDPTDGKISASAELQLLPVSTLPGTNAPTMVYPQDGQTLTCCSGYMFKVNPVKGASGYLFGFFQDGQMVYENWRDDRKLSLDGQFGIWNDNPFVKKIQGGKPMKVMIRALVNNQWTAAREITVNISSPVSTLPVTPSITSVSSKGGGEGEIYAGTPVYISGVSLLGGADTSYRTTIYIGNSVCPITGGNNNQLTCTASSNLVAGNKYDLYITKDGRTSNRVPVTVLSNLPTPVPTNQAPVISELTGPTSLTVNNKGEWKITARDPEGSKLTYTVRWGEYSYAPYDTETSLSTGESAIFTHLYKYAGIFAPEFTVSDSQGASAKKVAPQVRVEGNAPTFSFDQDGIYHRLFIKFGANGGKINSIKQVSPVGTCYSLTVPVAVSGKAGYSSIPNCPLAGGSYAANSSCGIYLQTKNIPNSPCQVEVTYSDGAATPSDYFESYLPAGNTVGNGERIREIGNPLVKAVTPTQNQVAQVINVLQALLNLLSGR